MTIDLGEALAAERRIRAALSAPLTGRLDYHVVPSWDLWALLTVIDHLGKELSLCAPRVPVSPVEVP